MSTDSESVTAASSATTRQPSEERRAVRGSVVVRGTGAPVPGVVAQLVAVDSATDASAPTTVSMGSSLSDGDGTWPDRRVKRRA